jgi:hypothetical protein
MDTETLLTKTSDLDKRFNIGKNTRVNRLVMLGLTPDKLEKQGRFYFLSAEQVELFADLDRSNRPACQFQYGIRFTEHRYDSWGNLSTPRLD